MNKLRLILPILFSFIFVPLFLFSQTIPPPAQLNIEFVSQLDYAEDMTDIWGYVDEDGIEYALVGTTRGVSIVSLEDPENPKELFFVRGVDSNWRDLKTFSNYVYISNETGRGLMIIDLSELPNDIEVKNEEIAGVQEIHNLWIDVPDGTLYMVGTDLFNGGMVMCDLTNDPWNPQVVGVYDRNYVHDVYVRDNLAYTAEIDVDRLAIVDVTEKSNPRILGFKRYRNSETHNTWLNDAGDVCFTTDETRDVYVRAWDVSNPNNIRPLDSIRSQLSDGAAIPHNVHVINDFLVTSYYTDGVHITDASHPEDLVEVGYFDTSFLSGARLEGCWGAYPFLPSGLILVTDIQRGLFVLKPTYKRASFVEGIVTDLLTDSILEDVFINILGQDKATFSKSEGDYLLGINDEGTFQLEVIKFGYLPDTVTVTLQRGETTIENIQLLPATTRSYNIQLIDKETREPIQSGQVQLASLHSGQSMEYRTNSDGRAIDSGLRLGYYDVIVGKWGYLSRKERLLLLEDTEQLVIELEQGYADNFSLDLGWKEAGTATSGRWERAIPRETRFRQTPINPPSDVDNDFGRYAYVTGNQGFTYDDDDVDGGFTRLSSPVFDLSDYENPTISFRWWEINYLAFSEGGQPGNGFLRIDLSNGMDTVEVLTINSAFNSDIWKETKFLVSDIMDASDEMRIHLTSADPEPDHVVEAGIDDFRVAEQAPTNIFSSEELENLQLYPNPVNNQLSISFQQLEAKRLNLSLIDLHGRLLTQLNIPPTKEWHQELAFPYPAGIYFLQIRKDNRLIAVRKLVKY